jgi:DNA topoisomerase II
MAQKYKKYTHLEHILARPDTYIGSLIPDVSKQWVCDDQNRMQECEIRHVGGLFKIFDEILVNAIDQCVVPESTVDKITVDVNESDGWISVYNTGSGVPVEQHPDHGNLWVPELIFGELLTSSNYDDTDQRFTGGRNGYGAKLANVFSKRFVVETACEKNKKKYIQEWTENMTQKNKAKITNWTPKAKLKGYTRVTFYPDFARFGMTGFDQIVRLLERRTYDACACTPDRVKVVYNGTPLSVKSFDKYIDLYIGDKKESARVFEKSEDGRWEIAVGRSSNGFKQVSFVNGIHTSIGGTHVEYIMSQIVKRVTDFIQTKHKDLKVKPQHIRDHLFLFVKSTIVNPTFSSQIKTECTTRFRDFGSNYRISDDFVKKMTKIGFIEDVVSLVKHRELRELNKTDGRKMSVIKGIPKLEDANKAGTSHSKKCTLILTEGDSAKTFAISGLGVVGRDYYGVFPLKGKLLNVRDATAKQLLNNEEITNIKQIMGLQMNKVYKDVTELRYGHIMILTDADVDGSHIKGLFMNFVHHFWPSLMENVPGFLKSMRTPILKCTKNNNRTLSFYTKSEYDKWKETAVGHWNIKYYKGLGTSTANEARDYFHNMSKNTVVYDYDKPMAGSIDLAFKKTLTNERKQWIQEGTRSKDHMTLDHTKNNVTLTDFVNKDLRWFSIADNERSIPSVVDGFKPSQRKVMYACRKRTNTDIKVSQLSGYVSTETCYHHGEQSLMSTIINMAQDYVGSNGMNLLVPNGQFGTRLMGGKDAASPRYIFTHLHPVTEKVIHADDDPLLTYLDDDGTKVEPSFFVPVLPMVLINGADGIGTGYSTQVPCYNPTDVRENVMRVMRHEPQVPMVPWYRGFTGTIEANPSDPTKFVTHGVWKWTDASTLEITELPLGKWTSDYKEYLESHIDDGVVKAVENHSTDTTVRFLVKINTKAQQPTRQAIDKLLKLTSSLSTGNMHLFDENQQMVHYKTTEEIISAFVRVRKRFYGARKEHLLRVYGDKHRELSEKIRFMRLVMDDSIVVFKRNRSDIHKQLDQHGFETSVHDTLLAIRLSSFTEENIKQLERNIGEYQLFIDTLCAKTVETLWIDDLTAIDEV